MPYTSFHLHFRKIAERETRTLTFMRDDDVIPQGSYGLLEMYCDDVNCDCHACFSKSMIGNEEKMWLSLLTDGRAKSFIEDG